MKSVEYYLYVDSIQTYVIRIFSDLKIVPIPAGMAEVVLYPYELDVETLRAQHDKVCAENITL